MLNFEKYQLFVMRNYILTAGSGLWGVLYINLTAF